MKGSYSSAYSEVLEVLKYIPKEDYNKIPKKTIQLFEINCDETSEFTYNIAIPFDQQKISQEAKLILAILYRSCWISLDERVELSKLEKEYLAKLEQEKREKYNPDELFEKRQNEVIEKSQENHYLVVQEKWYEKILGKLKKLFKRRDSK